jgi:hypothetical protein
VSNIESQRTLSIASLQRFEAARAKVAAQSAPFVPVVETAIETPAELAHEAEHQHQAEVSTDALHRLQEAQEQAQEAEHSE